MWLRGTVISVVSRNCLVWEQQWSNWLLLLTPVGQLGYFAVVMYWRCSITSFNSLVYYCVHCQSSFAKLYIGLCSATSITQTLIIRPPQLFEVQLFIVQLSKHLDYSNTLIIQTLCLVFAWSQLVQILEVELYSGHFVLQGWWSFFTPLACLSALRRAFINTKLATWL